MRELPPEIRSILSTAVESGKAFGIVAGMADEKGSQHFSFGKLSADDARAPDGDTLFEIASVTKVFTALLLAEMVQRGEVALIDPVQKFLPSGQRVPMRGGRQITLLDLSMHVSALPRLPDNLFDPPSNTENPYCHYTAALMYNFLSRHELTRDIGEKYEYSNFGFGLLGHALALRLGMSYEQALRERIWKPLGMASTVVDLTEATIKKLAPAHNASLQPVPPWDQDVLAGAGGVRSSISDMLKFMVAQLQPAETPLQKAMQTLYSRRRPTPHEGIEIAMSWHISRKKEQELIWHNGATGGYRAFAGLNFAKKTASVVLSNTFYDVDDAGFRLLTQ